MQIKRRALPALLLVVFFVVLVQLNQNRSEVSRARETFFDRLLVSVYNPLNRMVTGATRTVAGTWNHYFSLVGIARENDRLEDERRRLRLDLLSLREELKSCRVHDQLMAKGLSLGFEGVWAKVISYDPYSQSQTVWISAGSNEGVRVDGPVASLDGLVGRVVRVQASTSQVLLMVDAHFAVDVINERSRVRALVVGSGRGGKLERYPLLSHLEYLRLGDDMKPEDLLITSGLGGLYPPGIPVGIVDQKLPAIVPLADVSRLEDVLVLKSGGVTPAKGGGSTP